MSFENLLKKWNGGIERGAQARLVAETGLSKALISNYISGRQKPSEAAIKKIAQALQISEEELDNVFNNIANEERAEVMLIPVLGTSSATEEKFILEEAETYLPIKKSSAKQFAVRVEGNCMVDPEDPQNSIYHGNYIIVDPDADATNGDVVLARIDEEYSTIKRMFVKGKEVKLIPDNPACTTIIKPVKSVEIIGKVVNVYRPVKKKKERK